MLSAGEINTYERFSFLGWEGGWMVMLYNLAMGADCAVAAVHSQSMAGLPPQKALDGNKCYGPPVEGFSFETDNLIQA